MGLQLACESYNRERRRRKSQTEFAKHVVKDRHDQQAKKTKYQHGDDGQDDWIGQQPTSLAADLNVTRRVVDEVPESSCGVLRREAS